MRKRVTPESEIKVSTLRVSIVGVFAASTSPVPTASLSLHPVVAKVTAHIAVNANNGSIRNDDMEVFININGACSGRTKAG